MSYGPISVFEANIVSFGTTSTAVNLGRAWKNVFLEIPSMTSNSQIHIQAANTLGSIYRRVMHPLQAATTPVGIEFLIPSAVTNRMVLIPNGQQFIKVETTATVSFTAAFKIICSD